MKHFLHGLLGVLILAGMLVSACTVPPVPVTPTLTLVPPTKTHVPRSPTPSPSPSPTASPSPTPSPTATATSTPTSTPEPGGLPDMPDKPVPQGSTFQGCPAEGNGGDPRLDTLKNRIDEGNYVPVTFDAILGLTWPKTTERRHMDTWSAEDAAAIAKYEGIPVAVEGYLFEAKQSGSESTNCHETAANVVDWHIWLTKNAGDDRTHSIVIEATGRIRALHKWTLAALEQIARNQLPVRISGWLFFDPEHPDQILKTRGTLWEIHPIMQIQVLESGRWLPLDDSTS